MSYYSDSTIKTQYLDPRIYVENSRATFELDSNEAAYLPDMRLTFLGVKGTALTNYNDLVGAMACVRSFTLYDGKQILSALNRQQFYRGFLNQNKVNSVNEKVASYLDCSQLGFSINGTDRKVDKVSASHVVNTTNATTDTAWLDMREIFPILGQMTHLPTAVFKNLRVVIEYEMGSQVSNITNNTLTTLRPVLAVNIMTNPAVVDALNRKMLAVSWLEVEHDQFNIPSAPSNVDNVEQSLAIKLNGFNAKRLERMLIVKEIANSALEENANATLGFGQFSSQAVFKQKFQLRVNGRNMFPRASGITGENEMLAHVVEAYGDCNAYPGSNQYGLDISTIVAGGRNVLGQLSYIGVYVGERIADLQIDISRTGLIDAGGAGGKKATTDELRCHVFGESRKQLTMAANNTYVISYQQ
jgi:hypothetical protein